MVGMNKFHCTAGHQIVFSFYFIQSYNLHGISLPSDFFKSHNLLKYGTDHVNYIVTLHKN